MPAGRPTVMTPEVIAKLEEGFTMGFSDSEACLYANISKDSLYRYCEKNKEFSDRKEILKNSPKLLAKRNIYNALFKGDKTDDAKWLLERRDPDYKNKTDLTSDNKPLPLLSGITNVQDNNSHNETTETKEKD